MLTLCLWALKLIPRDQGKDHSSLRIHSRLRSQFRRRLPGRSFVPLHRATTVHSNVIAPSLVVNKVAGEQVSGRQMSNQREEQATQPFPFEKPLHI
ncbi:MAG TPA: hypothetical protein VL485_19275 [Ktedonobacteraceae bacterium]|nr:hypothetical protein [Ktedonobacteraceae bacterium]